MASERSTVWRAIMPAVLVFLLALLWSGYWLWLFNEAQLRYDIEATRLAGKGLTLKCGEQDWGGYPFRIEMTCVKPDFTDSRGGVVAHAETGNAFVVMQAYDFHKVAALIDGPTIITPRDAAPITIVHQRILAAFQRLSDNDQRLSIEIPTVQVGEDVRAQTANIHFRARDKSILDIAASGEGLYLAIEDAKFEIDKAAIEADLPLAEIEGGEPWRAMAASGSKLNITRASLSKGALVITGEGSLTVTPTGHIDGRIKTIISDLDLFVEALKQSLPLDEKEIDQLKALGGVLATATGNKSVAADLVFKDGEVYFSAFKIGEIAPLF